MKKEKRGWRAREESYIDGDEGCGSLKRDRDGWKEGHRREGRLTSFLGSCCQMRTAGTLQVVLETALTSLSGTQTAGT